MTIPAEIIEKVRGLKRDKELWGIIGTSYNLAIDEVLEILEETNLTYK